MQKNGASSKKEFDRNSAIILDTPGYGVCGVAANRKEGCHCCAPRARASSF